MARKISFSIDDAQLVDENPNSSFSILSLDFFASGRNLHDMWVSEDTLMRTAETIKNTPLVWKYDPVFDDAYTHDEAEVPCGFVPESAEIKSRKLEDGRTMLSTWALVWKKYSGELLSFFRRDQNQKPVSVEMSVFETTKREDGLEELLDYKFEATTILGSLVRPAIPSANATVLQFAAKEKEEYQRIYRAEFSSKYSELDLSIPETIKNNVEKALSLHKAKGKGANSVVLALAHHLQKNTHADPARIKNMAKMLNNYAKKDLSDENSNEYISYLALGGQEGHKWASELANAIDKIDSQKLSYFTEQHDNEKKEVNLSMEDEEKKDEVENKEEEKQEEKKEEMAVENKEEEKENPEEKKEEDYSLESYMSVSEMMDFLGDDREVAEKEFARPDGEKNFAKVMGAMYAKMCKMAEECKKMSADKEEADKKFAEKEAECSRYAQENEQLKAFKMGIEKERFDFAVDNVLKEVEKVLPKEEYEKAKEDSVNFTLENITTWANTTRATAFKFSAGKENGNDGILRIGLTWGNDRSQKKSLWND